MYLHIGNQKNIRKKDIIGIFDADRTTASGITRKYLARAEERGQVDSAKEEIPKSFVVYRTFERIETPVLQKEVKKKKKGRVNKTTEKQIQQICFSQLSVSTLLKRVDDKV
jgi:hypothetical protein